MRNFMSCPLVSIIVPVYNTKKYLVDCIDTLIKQSYQNIEIILVDDGSTDGSDRICDEYRAMDKRVKVIHKPNEGLTSSRCVGIENMSGQYGMIVDSDDWVDTEAVEECINVIEETGAECVFFSYVREYDNKSLPVHIYNDSKLYVGKDVKTVYRRVWGLYGSEMSHPERLDSMVSCCMKLYSASVLKRAYFVDTKVVGGSDDALFNIYALHQCNSIFYLDKPFYHYRKHNNETLSSTYRIKLIEQYKELYRFFDEAKEKLDIDDECKQAYINRTALSIIGIGLNEIKNPNRLMRVKKIREYISLPRNKEAYKKMEYSQMPLVWRIFFFLVKHGLAFPVYLVLLAIMYLRSRV